MIFNTIIIFYTGLLLSSFFFLGKKSFSFQKILLIYSFIALVLFCGLRGNKGTDTISYIDGFKRTISLFDSGETILRFGSPYEVGYKYISILIKTFTNNVDIFFIVISFLALFFIYKSLQKYSEFIILGLMVYFVRFYFLRDWNQIRAGVSLAMILYSIEYVAKKDFRRFLIIWLLAVSFHISALIFLPFYFIGRKKITISIMISCCLCVFILHQYVDKATMASFLIDNMQMDSTYTKGEYAKLKSLSDGIFIYRSFILFILYAYGNLLRNKVKYFDVFRNCYLMGLIVSIIFFDFNVISGRLSSVFDTVEVILVPAIIYLFKPKIFGYIMILAFISILYYMNVIVRLANEDFFLI